MKERRTYEAIKSERGHKKKKKSQTAATVMGGRESHEPNNCKYIGGLLCINDHQYLYRFVRAV